MVSPLKKLAQTLRFRKRSALTQTIRSAFVAFLSLSRQVQLYYLQFGLDYFPPHPFHFIIDSYLIIQRYINWSDRLCGLVVRVPGYRSRGPGFDSRRYQIFWEVEGLERGPLSLVRIIEELLEWKSSGSGLRKPNLTAGGIRSADHETPSIRKSWHYLRRHAAVARSV
jgi:hypothetical protein